MRRREFIAGALGSVAMWPVRSHAQKPTFVIGFLSAAWPDEELAKAVRQGLSDSGLVAGRNLTIEYRYANGKYDLLPSLAAELKSLPVSLIIAMPAPAAAAAKAATSTIPIVFLTGANPIESGLVPSYNKPGGNVTGIAMPANEIQNALNCCTHYCRMPSQLQNWSTPKIPISRGS